MQPADLLTVANELEAASNTTSTANAIPAGFWLRIAKAAEAGTQTTSTLTTNTLITFMRRAAVALESKSGTTGVEESDTYEGLLKRIVDALESTALGGTGTAGQGSLENRLRVSGISAVFNAYAAYALAMDYDSASYNVSGTRYGEGEPNLLNLALHSQAFNNAVWTKTGAVTADTTVAPDGKLTADTFAGGTSDNINQVITVATSTAYTASVWMRSLTGANVSTHLNFSRGSAVPDFTLACTVTPTWQQFTIVGTTAATAAGYFFQVGEWGANLWGPTGNIALWQAQLVAGSLPGPNILTTTAPATSGVGRTPGYTFTRSGVVGGVTKAKLTKLGPELVSNGTFDTNTSNWVPNGAANGEITYSSVEGRLNIVRGPGGNSGSPSQSIPVTAGKKYNFSFTDVTGFGAFSLSNVAENTTNPQTTDIGAKTFTVTATGSSMVVTFWADASSTAQFDNVSVKEMVADNSNVELLGPELVTDTGFDSAAAWTAGAGSSVSGGKANFVNASAQLFQAASVSIGRRYQMTVVVSSVSAGTIQARLFGGGSFALPAAGTYTFIDTVTTANTNVGISASSATAEVDSFSVKEVTADAISYFPTNVPMINDRGYHAYGALTNLAIQSSAFVDQAVWANDGCTVTANATLAPDGTATADTLTAHATTAEHRIYQTISSGNHGKSFFAKAGTASFISVSNGTAALCAVFNLATGVVSSATGVTATITPVGNGWYRCHVYDSAATIYIVANIGTTAANAVAQTLWLGASETVHLWQAQAFASGNFPDGGPIIPTGATTASIGASEMSQSSTFPAGDFIAFAVVANISPGAVASPASWGDATDANRLILNRDINGTAGYYARAAGVDTNAPSSLSANYGTGRVVIGVRRKDGKWTPFGRYGSTNEIGPETGLAGLPAVTKVSSGWWENGGTFRLNGINSEVSIKPGTMTNAELTTFMGTL